MRTVNNMAKYRRPPALKTHKPPRDRAAEVMAFDQKRKEKREHRNQLLKEWKLGQAQNLHDTYSSMIVRREDLATRPQIRKERDQIHRLLKSQGALRPNKLPL